MEISENSEVQLCKSRNSEERTLNVLCGISATEKSIYVRTVPTHGRKKPNTALGKTVF